MVLLLALAWSPAAPAAERLVLIGGGTLPPAAMQRFVEWAGGTGARLLVVPWASAEPPESAASIGEELRPWKPGRVEVAPLAPLDAAKRATLLGALASATAVFFTGGDQGRIMDVLRDEGLLRAFRERYRRGGRIRGDERGHRRSCPHG